MSLLASGHPRSVPKRDYVSDWRRVGRYYVHRYSIITTDTVVYATFEVGKHWSTHSSWMTGPNGEALGTVVSRALPKHIDRLRGTTRYAAVDKWHKRLDHIAYKAIRQAYPESRNARERGMGQIEGTLANARGR